MKDSDWETLSEIRQGCIRKLFEEGRYEDTLITTCHYEGRVTINYSFNQLDEDRKRKERQARLEKERQEAMDRYNAAVQWARDHGANLRKGKVSKDLMKFRIYKAGLMDEFNKAWPMFAFSEEDVKIASERLIERDIEYLHKPKKSKKDPEQEIRDKYSLD